MKPRGLNHPATRHTVRLLAALPGAYALSAALVGVLGALFSMVGLSRSDAVVLASMLGFVIYLLLLLWVFAQRSLVRVCLVVTTGLVLSAALLGSLAPAWG